MLKIGITCGDINGIGPEIAIKSIKQLKKDYKYYLIGPKNVFLNQISRNKLSDYSNCEFVDLGKSTISYGAPSQSSGNIALTSISESIKLWDEKVIDVIVTSPISKEAILKAGSKFPGHTEIFANRFRTDNYAMMFLSKIMIAALATIHEPIKKLSRIISRDLLEKKFSVIKDSLKQDFRKLSPTIAVLGLNPHAGESGLIGTEEKEIVSPVIKKLNSKRVIYRGPFSADGFYGQKCYKKFDCVVGMYHDQILVPFKLLNFNEGVNFTAGLPLIRTSPDHGTGFNLAGKNLANPKSMIVAIKCAEKIYQNRSSFK
ncbi:MAG: 4-hydroxythreonine-4-phosphate dehydrogenase PdxA [Ignavibacteria bacterium]|nr:4-hydroxythreonine-4-phosphate dehydrogenase PdxA [Ignavibacteria bacterium]